MPTQELVLHFLTVLPAEDINELRKKIFRVLSDKGLDAVANIEATRGEDGTPNNTVHFHIITDDQHCEEELRKILETACNRQGLVKNEDFCITYKLLPDGCNYFYYFTKYGEKYFNEVILFQPGLLKSKASEKRRTFQKFYVLGQWFQKDRGKGKIWDEIKAFMKAKYGTDPDMTDCKDEQVAINDIYIPGLENPTVYPNECPDRQNKPSNTKPTSSPITIKLPQEHKRTLDGSRIPDCHDRLSDGNYHPVSRTGRDRRREWERFRYSVAVLE